MEKCRYRGGFSASIRCSNYLKTLLEHLHALHLQALFEMGSIRIVDRVSAEQLMASFAHVNLVMGEDLNKSLRSLVDITKGACSDLLVDIRSALGPTMFNAWQRPISTKQ